MPSILGPFPFLCVVSPLLLLVAVRRRCLSARPVLPHLPACPPHLPARLIPLCLPARHASPRCPAAPPCFPSHSSSSRPHPPGRRFTPGVVDSSSGSRRHPGWVLVLGFLSSSWLGSHRRVLVVFGFLSSSGSCRHRVLVVIGLSSLSGSWRQVLIVGLSSLCPPPLGCPLCLRAVPFVVGLCRSSLGSALRHWVVPLRRRVLTSVVGSQPSVTGFYPRRWVSTLRHWVLPSVVGLCPSSFGRCPSSFGLVVVAFAKPARCRYRRSLRRGLVGKGPRWVRGVVDGRMVPVLCRRVVWHWVEAVSWME